MEIKVKYKTGEEFIVHIPSKSGEDVLPCMLDCVHNWTEWRIDNGSQVFK